MISPERIRQMKDRLFREIADCNANLEWLRTECPHQNISEGYYEWATAHLIYGEICDDCGKFIKETENGKDTFRTDNSETEGGNFQTQETSD